MAKKKQQPDRKRKRQPGAPAEEESLGVPSAKERIGGSPPASLGEETAHGDLFASLAEFATPKGTLSRLGNPFASAPGSAGPEPAGLSPEGHFHQRLRRLSRVQQVLLVAIVAAAAVFVYTLMGQISAWRRSERREPVQPSRAAAVTHASQPFEPMDQPARSVTSGPALPSPEPLSLQLAEQLYLRRDFEHALATYETLCQRLPATDDHQPFQDMLLLRMALCHKNGGNMAQADTLLRTVSLSRLPILRALARYHQALTLLDRQRYLEATAKAYQALGLIELIDYDRKWVTAVQQQCRFLIAEAMTRHFLSLCDADSDVPPQLWTQHPEIDPFGGMEEAQLRVFLAAGCERLNEALLSPHIRAAGDRNATSRWSVLCNGAPLEELLARFGAHARLNVQWTDSGQAAPGEDSQRKRPVYLCLALASSQDVVTTAAGSVGLLARMDGRGNVLVLDPAFYSSLAEHTKLLAEESVSLWQRLLLASEDDQRSPSSHFALGLLHTARGQLGEAAAEYKLVANRFAKHALAPYALLYSGKLKVRLRDYVGAHEDLKQLVEFYPETELSDQACLHLADATMKAGLYEEATSIYRKVYNLGLSIESQMESALGAGRCYFETQDYEQAETWLDRYITLARDQNRPEFHAACLWLGKTYLGLHKPQQAHAALNTALKGELSRQQHMETITVLAQAYIEQGALLDALHVLESTGAWQLSQQETIELLLLRTRVLRAIALADKAVTLLAEKDQFLPNPELKGKMAIELARCHTESGDLERARKTLGEAFALAAPGPVAREIGCELARTCLRLGQPAQAVSVCCRLLEHTAPDEKGPILDLLAEAYRRQGKYDLAVVALLDRHDTAGKPSPRAPAPSAGVAR